jgi:hypothetical protein
LRGQSREVGFELAIRAESGSSYRLQASPDLSQTNWFDLIHSTNSQPATTFVDTNATNFNRRFYRVLSQ